MYGMICHQNNQLLFLEFCIQDLEIDSNVPSAGNGLIKVNRELQQALFYRNFNNASGNPVPNKDTENYLDVQ